MSKSPPTPIHSLFIVIASFVAASVINIYPLTLDASKFRPMALMMVLVFWLLLKPRYIGVGTAFVVGIIADLLLDTRLGQQGFSAVMMAFSIRLVRLYLRQLTLPIAWLVATSALIIFQSVLWITQFITQNIFIAHSVFGLIMSVVTWPIVFIVLTRFHK